MGRSDFLPPIPGDFVSSSHGYHPFAVETTGPPRFLGDLLVRALLFDPGGFSAPGQHGALMLPSVITTTSAPAIRLFRGSITQPARLLSTLRSEGCPSATQDSLPGGGQPFPGRGLMPCKVPKKVSEILHLFPLPQALPGAL